MKKIVVTGGIVATIIALHFGFSERGLTYAGGPPTAKTGSPGDGANCTSCHAGTAQQTPGLITSNVPLAGYSSDSTYTFSVSISAPGKSKFGFQASPQTLAGGKMGTLIATNPTTTQLAGAGKYIHHRTAGTSGIDGKTWTFDWIPPPSGSGDLAFYTAVNVTNSNNTSSGDITHVSSLLVIENPANAQATSASNDVATVVENGNVIIDVQDNDVSNSGNPLTTAIVTQPLNGFAIVLNGDSIHYVPGAGFSGSDTIVYSICDNATPALCDTALVLITVTPAVGIAYKDEPIKIKAYPNPASFHVNIESVKNIREKVQIRDLRGTFVETKESGSGKTRIIDVSELPAGYYLIEVDGMIPVKILVVR